MNERIRELELQCFVFSEQTNKRIFDREKFAELLLKDAAAVVDSQTDALFGVANRWCTGQDLLDHFGVK